MPRCFIAKGQNMKTTTAGKWLAALAGALLLLSGGVAHADRDHWRDRDHREWRQPDRHHDHRRWDPPGHRRDYRDYRDYRGYDDRPIVIRERHIAPRYIDRDLYYYPAPPPRYYRRDPAITRGVDVPPIVIPLR